MTATTPAIWKRQAASAQTALLTTEHALLERMRRAVDIVVKQHATSDTAKGAKNAAIMAAAESLRRHLPAVIAAGQADARNAALRTVHDDVYALKGALRKAGESDELPGLPMPSQRDDTGRARDVSHSYADAWLAAALASEATTARAAMKEASTSTAFRITRTAATENSRAFNDERSHGLGILTKATIATAVRKRWDATLDAATCEVCSDLDGQEVSIAESFHDADGVVVVPGAVHPNCRCVSTIVV